MTDAPHLDVSRRHDFLLLFDVTGGNPNGDPDNGNAPRIDPLTGAGWVTDVALKRKVRNFVADLKGDEEGFGIYVGEGVALNARHREASEVLGLKEAKGGKRSAADQTSVGALLATQYYDIRAFGAVMSTGDHPAGQLRGPIQIACPITSVDPLDSAELTITRVAVTNEKELEKLASGEGGKDREMGSKHTVPYALFAARGFFTPAFAEKTGFSSGDLALFWDSLRRMWALDRSASRGMTGCRGLHVFTHSDRYGRTHPDNLFSRVSISRASEAPARSFTDYAVSLDLGGLDDLGVTHVQLAS